MGTRAMLYVTGRRDAQLVNIYRHFDGYPEYIGKRIYEIVSGRRMATGINFYDWTPYDVALGPEDLAAILVARLKAEATQGDILIVPGRWEDRDPESASFLYLLSLNPDREPHIRIETMNDDADGIDVVYDGPVSGMAEKFGFSPKDRDCEKAAAWLARKKAVDDINYMDPDAFLDLVARWLNDARVDRPSFVDMLTLARAEDTDNAMMREYLDGDSFMPDATKRMLTCLSDMSPEKLDDFMWHYGATAEGHGLEEWLAMKGVVTGENAVETDAPGGRP